MHRQSIPHATRHRGALLPAVPARRPRSRPPPRLSPRRRAGGGEQLPPGIQGLVSDLRSDPALAPLLDDPKLAAAIQEVARDPCALQRYANDPKVMAILGRLLERDLPPTQAAAFSAMGTTPRGALSSMTSDAELAQLLGTPKVRQALGDIKADPDAGMARWAGDADVQRALDLLEAALGGGGGGVIDV